MNPTQLLTGDQKLHTVARKRATIASHLVFTDEIINATNLDSETPLIVAVKERSLPTIRSLVRMRLLNINYQDKEGNSALHYAISRHELTFIAPLCAAGANPMLLNVDGQSCLHIAAKQADPTVIRTLLIHSTIANENINALNDEGDSPLTVAVKAENLQVVNLLVRKNASTLELDLEGNMPLHWAAKIGNAQIARRLIGTSAISHRNNDGYTPLMLATRRGHNQIFDLLRIASADFALRDSEENSLLHLACHPPDVSILRFLLTHRHHTLKKNVKNADGRTPLQYACVIGNLQAVEELFNAKETMCITDYIQQTPLMTAIAYNHTAVAEFLISKITDVNKPIQLNHRDYFGNTPLHLCSISDNVRIARLLITNGALLTAMNNNGHTPISIIAHTKEKSASEVYASLYADADVDQYNFFPVAETAQVLEKE